MQMQMPMQNAGFNIIFSLNGNFIGNMFVTGDMMFAAVVNNLYQYHPYISQYQPTFYFNSNPLKPDSCKKLKDLGMQNMSTVEIKTIQPAMGVSPNMPINKPGNENQFLNIYFNAEGRAVLVLGTKNDKFSDISKKFCTKFDDDKNRIPSYLLNNSMIDANDNRTLNELGIHDNQKIEVVFTQNVIGAYC